ncbi:hypothetical protein P7K49_005826 [Saguinus oedipus]|uniref:Secreted protein n=1 Tax=Saguinus oedipus TaxID=9490 RepID=A0ABQ9W1G8_SAGOE|nr:hypothetical protein P7K49_005826 [Saguinus oedipus]
MPSPMLIHVLTLIAHLIMKLMLETVSVSGKVDSQTSERSRVKSAPALQRVEITEFSHTNSTVCGNHRVKLALALSCVEIRELSQHQPHGVWKSELNQHRPHALVLQHVEMGVKAAIVSHVLKSELIQHLSSSVLKSVKSALIPQHVEIS